LKKINKPQLSFKNNKNTALHISYKILNIFFAFIYDFSLELMIHGQNCGIQNNRQGIAVDFVNCAHNHRFVLFHFGCVITQLVAADLNAGVRVVGGRHTDGFCLHGTNSFGQIGLGRTATRELDQRVVGVVEGL